MKHFEQMVDYYRNHTEEAKKILKNAGKLDETKWSSDVKELENIDELFLDDVSIHIEKMGPETIWFGFTLPNGQIDHFVITCKGKELKTLYTCNTGNVNNQIQPTIIPKHNF